MRNILLILGIFTTLAGFSQNFARSFKAQFGSLQFIDGKVLLYGIGNNDNDQFIASGEEFLGTYQLNKDTIEMNFKGNKYCMLKKSDGIIISLSNIFYLIKKGETLFATKYCYSNGDIMLLGREWRNGGKNGKWLFFDENGVESGLIFDEGKIVGTYIPVVIDEGEE